VTIADRDPAPRIVFRLAFDKLIAGCAPDFYPRIKAVENKVSSIGEDRQALIFNLILV
jgi:hypothetical protein